MSDTEIDAFLHHLGQHNHPLVALILAYEDVNRGWHTRKRQHQHLAAIANGTSWKVA